MIYLSAGHQGAKTGASKLIDEGSEAIRLRDSLTAELRSIKRGAVIYNDAVKASLTSVIADVNKRCKAGRDIAIEIHFNSGSTTATGVESVIAVKHSQASEQLAIGLSKAVAAALHIPIRGGDKGFKLESETPHKSLGFCNKVKCPSVILEICFIGHPNDVAAYREHYDELVHSLASYLTAYL